MLTAEDTPARSFCIERGIVQQASKVPRCSPPGLLQRKRSPTLHLYPAVEAIISFRDAVNRSDAWQAVLSTWTCPTPSNSSNSSCDPCGEAASLLQKPLAFKFCQRLAGGMPGTLA